MNGITVHVASRYHERARHRREELVEWIETIDPAPDPAALVESCRVWRDTIDAMSELAPDLRAVLVAHELDEIPMAQIAEAERVPISTLYKRRTRAIGVLRNVIGRREAEENSIQNVRAAVSVKRLGMSPDSGTGTGTSTGTGMGKERPPSGGLRWRS